MNKSHLVISKNATSCRMMLVNRLLLRRATSRCPDTVNSQERNMAPIAPPTFIASKINTVVFNSSAKVNRQQIRYRDE